MGNKGDKAAVSLEKYLYQYLYWVNKENTVNIIINVLEAYLASMYSYLVHSPARDGA